MAIKKPLIADEKKGTRGRIDPSSALEPGYPGLRDIHLNAKIHELLGGGELIGVKLTDASEFSPTGTTGAVCSFHPEARYT